MVFGLSRLLRGLRGRGGSEGVGLGLLFHGIKGTLSRNTILRLSFLLIFYSIFVSLPLPLNNEMQSYVWTILFTSFNASLFGSILASFFHIPALESIFRIFFDGGQTSVLLKLYGALIMVLGGLWGIGESAIVVYWAMQIARILEDKMFASIGRTRYSNGNSNGSGAWKSLIIGISVMMNVLWIMVLGWLYALTDYWVLPAVCLFFGIIVGMKALATDGGNLFEFSGISLYIGLLIIHGLYEEVFIPTFLFDFVVVGRENGDKSVIMEEIKNSYEESQIIIFSVSSLISILALASVPRVLGAVFDGADNDRPNGDDGDDDGQNRSSISRDRNFYHSRQGRQRDSQSTTSGNESERGVWWKGPLNAFSLMILTFQFLVWKRQVEPGEYFALGCRALHASAAVLFYFIFRKMEEEEEEEGGNGEENKLHHE